MTGDAVPHLYSVEIKTARWEEMVQWYRQVISLRVLIRVVDDGYAQLQAGGAHLALIRVAAAPPASERISLAFEVSSVDELAKRLSSVSHPFEKRLRDNEGFWELITTDPDGNRLRFFEWPFGG